jgi:glycosyltransferase involved in cell wall biosynthesis
MKIIHIAPMYAPAVGGAEDHMRAISERLAARGHDVTVITADVTFHEDLWPGRAAGLPESETINRVRVIRFPPDGGALRAALSAWQKLPGGYRSLRLMFGEEGLALLARKPFLSALLPYLLRTRADIVTSANWYWPPAYHAYLARKLKRFALVGIPLFHTAEAWCSQDIYRHMLGACDAVIVNTEHEADFVRRRAATRVVVGGVGVDPELFRERNGSMIRRRNGLDNRPVVGFVGRQAANKGAAQLLRAMANVWRWNSEVRLVLAGPRANLDKQMEPAFAGLTAFEKERIVRIDDFAAAEKASLFDAFDVFVLPSTAESFGIAYLEAWLCKKPVVGANIGPTRCVINEGVDGLLVNPGDPSDIAGAVINLLSDPSRRRAMGESGYEKTVSRFTWEQVTDKVEGLYLTLQAKKRRGGRTR